MLQSAARARSIDELLTSAGYLDRTALIVAVALVPFGVVEAWWPALYLVVPMLTVLQAMRRADVRPASAFLTAAAGMFISDLAVSVRSAVEQVAGTTARWEERQ